jgi:hypothetical protein
MRMCQLPIFLWGNAKATATVTVTARYVSYPLSLSSFLRLLKDAIISPFCFSFCIFKESLVCMQRSGIEDVPGCIGSGLSAYDYCFHSPSPLTYIGETGWHKECEGDCDDDWECDVSNASRNLPTLFDDILTLSVLPQLLISPNSGV